jgi:hypothetical protein
LHAHSRARFLFHPTSQVGTRSDPTWGKLNVGVDARGKKDELLSSAEARAASLALQRKAEIYEKLLSGKLAGVNDTFLYELLAAADDLAVLNYSGPAGSISSAKRGT